MKKRVFTDLFGYLYRKKIFSVVITLFLAFGIFSWFYFRAAIQENIQYRLDSELEFISSEINEKFSNYALTLNYVHSYFRTHGIPSQAEFTRLVENIADTRLQNGIQGIGYLDLIHGPRLQAPVRMVEPMNSRRSRMIGFDLFTEESRRETILDAVHSGQMRLSKHRLPGPETDPDLQLVSSLMLAYFGRGEVPPPEERLRAAKGIVYVPIRFREFFETAFGPPDAVREKVNFTFSYVEPDSNREEAVYRRFAPERATNTLQKSKIIEVYGRTWRITAIPLPHFFSFGDRYLAFIVAVVFLLFSALLLVVFYQTQNLLEHETTAKNAMQDADRMKTAFLSNVSHEIRTPLNAITGFSEILSRAEGADQKAALLEGIRKNSSELTGIIDNMLDISKIEFGKIHIHHDNICFLSIISPLHSVIQARAQEKHLNFRIDSSDLLPAGIQVDAGRVKQILLNLLGNAVKFTDTGSVTLTIHSETSAEDTHYLIFDVADTGIGISEADRRELFQSFSQLDVSSTRRFGGVGLGLRLSWRLAQQLGGDVSLVKSTPGEGSVFRLKIPCGVLPATAWKTHLFENMEEPGGTTHPDRPAADLKGKQILIVEDSPDNQDIFEYFLKSAGALPDVVGNGEDAVQRARHGRYDLILMDIQLPKMDGLEATRQIRALGFVQPIVALTAHASPEEKTSCLNAGCVDLITKPVSQEILIHRILTVLGEPHHEQQS